MRRLLLLGIVCGLGPSSALAADHQMRISEVLLSSGGNGDYQYVELIDPGEPFSAAYELVVYDADGIEVGSDVLAIDPATTRYVVASSDANADGAWAADETWAVALPADGQVCFERTTNNVKIHCLRWGCINTPVGPTSSGVGPSPGDGMSLQRQGNGSYQLATPTPAAANASGTSEVACDGDVFDASPPGAPDAAPGDAIDGGADGLDGGGGGGGDGDGDGDGDGGGDEDGGCGCRAGTRSGGALSFLALVIAMAFARRRR